jgi:hypothetical protein
MIPLADYQFEGLILKKRILLLRIQVASLRDLTVALGSVGTFKCEPGPRFNSTLAHATASASGSCLRHIAVDFRDVGASLGTGTWPPMAGS